MPISGNTTTKISKSFNRHQSILTACLSLLFSPPLHTHRGIVVRANYHQYFSFSPSYRYSLRPFERDRLPFFRFPWYWLISRKIRRSFVTSMLTFFKKLHFPKSLCAYASLLCYLFESERLMRWLSCYGTFIFILFAASWLLFIPGQASHAHISDISSCISHFAFSRIFTAAISHFLQAISVKSPPRGLLVLFPLEPHGFGLHKCRFLTARVDFTISDWRFLIYIYFRY